MKYLLVSPTQVYWWNQKNVFYPDQSKVFCCLKQSTQFQQANIYTAACLTSSFSNEQCFISKDKFSHWNQACCFLQSLTFSFGFLWKCFCGLVSADYINKTGDHNEIYKHCRHEIHEKCSRSDHLSVIRAEHQTDIFIKLCWEKRFNTIYHPLKGFFINVYNTFQKSCPGLNICWI